MLLKGKRKYPKKKRKESDTGFFIIHSFAIPIETA